MKYFRLISCCLLAVVSAAALAAGTAAAPRVYVSAQTGSNSNPCTASAPCRQIKYALTVVDKGGEIIALDSGHYLSFTVRKSVSIIGAPGAVVSIDRSNDPDDASQIDTIYIEKPDGANAPLIVVLRGLTLNGGERHGINFFSGDVLHVEQCVINGFKKNGIEFNRGSIFPPAPGTGDGQLFLKDTSIRNNGASAVLISGYSFAVKAVIEHCRLENNFVGLEVGGAQVTARDSVIAATKSRGIYAAGTNQAVEVHVENCLVENGQTGVESAGGSRGGLAVVRLSNSTITNHSVGVNATNGAVLSRVNNTIEGNGQNIAGGQFGTYAAK